MTRDEQPDDCDVVVIGGGAAGGAFAGAQVNADLATADTRLAVETRRVQHAVAAR